MNTEKLDTMNIGKSTAIDSWGLQSQHGDTYHDVLTGEDAKYDPIDKAFVENWAREHKCSTGYWHGIHNDRPHDRIEFSMFQY